MGEVNGRRRALVVGNTDGIGLGLTKRLLASGFTVTGVSRRASPLDDAGYLHAVLDVSTPAYRQNLAALHDLRGPFDLCVYCAGVGEPFDPSGTRELSNAADVMRVNLVGAADTAAVAIPAMLASGGHFVALSSIGDVASAAAPSYGASKAGLSAWLGGLALALRAHTPRVYVTNVRLGFADTKMAKSAVRPMMMSVERAVDVVWECVGEKPARRTYPLAMQLLVSLIGLFTSVRLWFA